VPAHEFGPVISPDGKWVAYLSNARGPTDVWVKFIAGGDPANLTATANIDVQANDYIGGLDVSPDGTQIALLAQGKEQGQGTAAWVIPAPLGGVPRRALKQGDSGLHWSPDGKRIVFVDQLDLALNKPPRLRPYIVYCPIWGIISQHDELRQARDSIEDYSQTLYRLRPNPDAAIYRWISGKWEILEIP